MSAATGWRAWAGGRARWAWAPALVLAAAVLGACGDGDDPASEGGAQAPAERIELPENPHGFPVPDPGDLDVDVPEGWSPVPLPSLGVGLAIPWTWEATLLTDEGLARIEEFSQNPGFVDAARNARASGALLYGAGMDAQGRVSDLKLSRLEVSLEAAEEAAAAAAPPGAVLDRPEGTEHPTVRVRFRVEAPGYGGEPVVAEGTQWLVQGPTVVWSVVVTSEDAAAHDELASSVLGSLTFSSGSSR